MALTVKAGLITRQDISNNGWTADFFDSQQCAGNYVAHSQATISEICQKIGRTGLTCANLAHYDGSHYNRCQFTWHKDGADCSGETIGQPITVFKSLPVNGYIVDPETAYMYVKCYE